MTASALTVTDQLSPENLAIVARLIGGAPESWSLSEIGDGNVNLIFRISGPLGQVLVKQAVPYLRCVGESWPLSLRRNFFERKAFEAHGALAPEHLPRVLGWNEASAALVMEFLGDHLILRKGVMRGVRYPKFAEHITDYMAKTPSIGSSSKPSSKSPGARPALEGKIALVTGAATGIGKACVDALRAAGAAVAAVDIKPAVQSNWKGADVAGIVADLTVRTAVDAAVAETVRRFGGLDIVVANAGIFPASERIESLDDDTWSKVLDVNLTSQMYLFRAAAPYLSLGVDPAIVVVASKNVAAPGPGAAAYSASKAAMTQLARVAALELGPRGVRVNMVHPHAVMDSALWTPEILASRAAQYGLSVEDYKRNNLLKVEVKSKDVADLVAAMAGSLFSKTTGAQLPIDGGSDRIV